MRRWRRLLRRIVTHLSPGRSERRLREEMEHHLALQIDEFLGAGLSPREARRQALIKFGGVSSVAADWRDEQRLPIVDRLTQDIRYAVRQLRRSPLFTATATIALAVGIGANAAIFTLIDRMFLRPLPVSHPERLVLIGDQRSQTQQRPAMFSYPFSVALRRTDVLAGIASRSGVAINVASDGRAARARGELVSGDYFRVVSAGTSIGRPLTADDDRTPGAHPVVVISDRFWRETFDADPSILGRLLRINTTSFTIVGVAAPAFTGIDVGLPTDVWIPMAMQREVGRSFLTDARSTWLELIGQLKPDQTLEAAAAALTAAVEQLTAAEPPVGPDPAPARRLVLQSGVNGKATAWRTVGSSLTLLMALAGLTLVLECFTIASLLIVRSLARQKETAVKLALGARRSHLISQCFTETLLLAVVGGTAGVIVAPWVTGLLVASQGAELSLDTQVDWRVLGFAMAVSLLTGLVVGLAPIIADGGIDGVQRRAVAVAIGTRTASSSRRHLLLRDVIVACQVGASLATLIVAALLVQSLRALNAIDPGFSRDQVLLIAMDPGPLGYDAARIEAFWRTALDRIVQMPNVRAASLANTVPLAPGRQRQPAISPLSGNSIEIDTNPVGPGYFRTLGIPLVRGREFSSTDGKDAMPVAIVNERLAQLFWPGQDPLGQALRIGSSRNRPAEVVGIVKDAKYRDLRQDADAMVYVPLFQTTSTTAKTLHVRIEGRLEDLASAFRREMQSLEPGLPLFGLRTIQEQHQTFLAQPRQAAAITSAFGVVALLLAVIGVYGVTAVAASRRIHDIGIRMALGATPAHIVRWIGGRGLVVVGIGLTVGLFGSFGLARLAGSLLFGIAPHDVGTFVVATVVLALASLAAIYVPARAATRLDAARAMRCD